MGNELLTMVAITNLFQKFHEVVSEQQQWRFATPGYFTSKIDATQTTIFARL
jgi:hypothetical protein